VGSSGVRTCECRDRISFGVAAGGDAVVVSGAVAGEGTEVCAYAVAVHTSTSAPTAAATIPSSVTALLPPAHPDHELGAGNIKQSPSSRTRSDPRRASRYD